MAKYSVDEIKGILELHKKWWKGEDGGNRADLRGADIRGAYLRGAYLRGADLQGADLRGAYLQGADLRGADLRGADIRGAYLQGAYLQGADLRGAYLQGADLQGADLQGAKYGTDDADELVIKYFTVGPIGSRSDYLQVFQTNKRIELKTGCFTGSVEDLESRVTANHGNNKHGADYMAAVAFIRQVTSTYQVY